MTDTRVGQHHDMVCGFQTNDIRESAALMLMLMLMFKLSWTLVIRHLSPQMSDDVINHKYNHIY